MKLLSTIAPNVSPKSHVPGVMPSAPILLAMHTFEAAPDGQLLHYINGQLRATVPPEGFEGYVESWPDCRPVVAELRGGASTAPAALIAPDDAPGT